MANLKMITTKEAAEILGQSPATLRGWRLQQRGPRYMALNCRNVRYAQSDILRYATEHLVTPRAGINEGEYVAL